MTESMPGPGEDPIQVTPVVALVGVPRAACSISIRDFVRRCLAEAISTRKSNCEVGETVFRDCWTRPLDRVHSGRVPHLPRARRG